MDWFKVKGSRFRFFFLFWLVTHEFCVARTKKLSGLLAKNVAVLKVYTSGTFSLYTLTKPINCQSSIVTQKNIKSQSVKIFH